MYSQALFIASNTPQMSASVSISGTYSPTIIFNLTRPQQKRNVYGRMLGSQTSDEWRAPFRRPRFFPLQSKHRDKAPIYPGPLKSLPPQGWLFIFLLSGAFRRKFRRGQNGFPLR